MSKRKNKDSMVGDMMNMAVGNLVAVPLMGASATQVAGLPAGMAKNIAGTAVGLQSVALLGHNVGFVKKSLKNKESYL